MTLAIPHPRTFAIYGGFTILLVIFLSTLTILVEHSVSEGTSDLMTRIFGVDHERNVPTAVSFALITKACLLVMVTAWQQFSVGSQWRRHWAGLGVVLLYIAFDEAAQIHEMLSVPLGFLGSDTGFFRFAWVIGGMAFFIAISAIFLRFVIALPPSVRSLVFASGAVYMAGAIGMEMIAAASLDWETSLVTYRRATMMEEMLEMTGMMVFATAIVTLLHQGTEGTRDYLAGPT